MAMTTAISNPGELVGILTHSAFHSLERTDNEQWLVRLNTHPEDITKPQLITDIYIPGDLLSGVLFTTRHQLGKMRVWEANAPASPDEIEIAEQVVNAPNFRSLTRGRFYPSYNRPTPYLASSRYIPEWHIHLDWNGLHHHIRGATLTEALEEAARYV
jgi:hypothetical protein